MSKKQLVVTKKKELKAQLEKDNNYYLEKILKELYKAIDNKQTWEETEIKIVTIFIQELFPNILKLNKEHIEEVHNYEINYKNIKIEEFLYHKDGKYFTERIHEYIQQYKKNIPDKNTVAYHMTRIVDTETNHLTSEIHKYAFKEKPFIAHLFIGGCDECQQLYQDNEIYRTDEISEFPPFHPSCKCDFYDWECDEIEARELYPEYFENVEE